MNVEEKVLLFIKEQGLISPGDKILLGVSGGPDSVFMFYVLNAMKDRIPFELAVAVFNHKLRKESGSEVGFVENLCKKFGTAFFYGEAGVKKYAEENGFSLEEAARKKRIEFLEKTMQENGFDKIALAHNKDDLVETILYHLIKGSGLSGLTGIKPKSFGGIIHPLLSVSRKEIEQYLEKNGIPYRTDRTNFLLSYSRNRIRHQIIPLFTSLNENFKENIFNMSEILAKEDEFIGSLAEKDAEVIKNKERFSLPLFLSLPVFEQRRIIKTLFGENTTFDRVERIIGFLKSGKRKTNLYGNFFIVKEGKTFFVTEETNPPFTIEKEYLLRVPGETEIPEAKCTINAGVSDYIDTKNAGDFRALFDFDELRFPLKVRFRKEGDRIKTESGTKKLQDLFVNKKIPRSDRAFVPIVVNGKGEILWVVGVRRSSIAKVSQSTRKVLSLVARFKKK